jgi:tRNA(fMet)-specific endonuclease VapC
MIEYLLDANHTSPLVTYSHPLRQRILNALEKGDRFFIATVVLAEALYGFGTLPRAEQNLAEWKRLRPSFRVYAIEEQDALLASDMRIKLRHIGKQLKTIDALIAAIALRYDLILLTTDKDFDAIPELKLANWLQP